MKSKTYCFFKRHQTEFFFASLFTLCLLVYLNQMTGGMIWDDSYSFSSQQISEFKRDPFQYTWLLTNFSYVALHEVFGERLYLYKAVSLLLHFINAIIVFKIMKLLRVMPYFISAVFLIHPVQTMSVSWISQIKTLEMSFFVLLSIFFYIKYHKQSKKSFIVATPLFVLANLFKWTHIALPIPIIAEKLFRSKNRKLKFSVITITAIIFSALAIYILSRDFVITYSSHVGERYYQRIQETLFFELPLVFNMLLTKIYIVFATMGHYISKSLIPIGLSPLYNPNQIFVGRFLFGIISSAIVILYTVKRRHYKAIKLYTLAVFSILPVLGIIWAPYMHFTPFSEQHAYLFIIFIFYLLQTTLLKKLPQNIRAWLMLFLVLLFSVKTYRYNYTFLSDQSFFQKVTEEQPKNFIAHLNLSTIYAKKESYTLALREASIAYELLDKASPRENNFLHDQFRSLTPYIHVPKKYLGFPLRDARLKGVDD